MDNEILMNNELASEQAQTEQPTEKVTSAAIEEAIEQMNTEDVESAAEQEEVAATPVEENEETSEEEAPAAAPARRAPQKIELVGSIIDDGNDMVFADMPGDRKSTRLNSSHP